MPLQGQFLEEFDSTEAAAGATPPGWSYATGDGEAVMSLVQQNGYARIEVDATGDRRNIWWALVRRPVPGLDLPGADLVDQKNLSYEYLVKGDIQILLQRLSTLPIKDLTFPEPDLEEVFMAYYRREE